MLVTQRTGLREFSKCSKGEGEDVVAAVVVDAQFLMDIVKKCFLRKTAATATTTTTTTTATRMIIIFFLLRAALLSLVDGYLLWEYVPLFT